MATFYGFLWQANVGGTFSLGSDVVYYPDGHVVFKNPLMSPGDAIYAWEDRDVLPPLLPGHSYVYGVEGKVIPADNLGIELEFFDADDDRIDHQVYAELQDSFEVPEDTVAYSLKLMNMNHQEVDFTIMWFGSLELFSSLDIDMAPGGRLVHVTRGGQDGDDPVAPGLEVVLMRDRQDIVPFSLNNIADTIYVRVPGTKLTDAGWVQDQVAALTSMIQAKKLTDWVATRSVGLDKATLALFEAALPATAPAINAAPSSNDAKQQGK